MKLINLWLFISILFMGLTSIVPESAAQNASEPEEEVIKQLDTLRKGLEDGVQSQDIDKLLSFTHPEIIVTWQNGELSRGPEEIRKFFDRMLTGPNSVLSKIVMKPMAVEGRKIFPDFVVSFGTMEEEYFFRDSDLRFTLTSRFSAWLGKENGKFLLRGLHLSANVFDNPVQALKIKKASWQYGLGGLVAGVLLTLLLCRMRCSKKGSCN